MITYETLKSFCGDDVVFPQLKYAYRTKDGWWASDTRKVIFVPGGECQQGDCRFLCDELPEEAGRYPNVENVVKVKEFVPSFTVSVKAIENALSRLPMTDEYKEVERELTFINCPNCNGEGEVEISNSFHYNGNWYDVSATTECPICHGYGKIPDKEDYNPNDDNYDPDDENYTTHVKTGKKIPDVDGTLMHLPGDTYFVAKYANDILRVAREQGVTDIECNVRIRNHIVLFRMHGVIVGIMPYLFDKEINNTVEIEL